MTLRAPVARTKEKCRIQIMKSKWDRGGYQMSQTGNN